MDCNAKVKQHILPKTGMKICFYNFYTRLKEKCCYLALSAIYVFLFFTQGAVNCSTHPNPPSMVRVRQQLPERVRGGLRSQSDLIDSKADKNDKIITLCTISYIYIIYDDIDKDRSERGFFYQAIYNPTLSDHCELYGFWKPTCKTCCAYIVSAMGSTRPRSLPVKEKGAHPTNRYPIVKW